MSDTTNDPTGFDLELSTTDDFINLVHTPHGRAVVVGTDGTGSEVEAVTKLLANLAANVDDWPQPDQTSVVIDFGHGYVQRVKGIQVIEA